MKKIISVCLMVVLLFVNYNTVCATNMHEEQNIGVSEQTEGEFKFEIVRVEEKDTRDYARNFQYTVNVTYNYYVNNVLHSDFVCEYYVNLSYSYTSNNAVITNFTCTRGTVTSGYTVTCVRRTNNGNPAYAKLTPTATKNSTGLSQSATFVFRCKVSGNVDVYTE